MAQQQLSKKQRCPRCGKTKIITDEETGEMFCGKCGFVITDRVDNGFPEESLLIGLIIVLRP